MGQFRFATFGKNTVDLIATVDSSGRNLFYGLVGVCRTDTGYRHFMLESAPPHLLAAEVIDLDGTGINQLIVKRLVGQYRGASTAPILWYSIYNIKGCVPKDVSTKYPQFYQKEVLPSFAFVERALSEKSAEARKRYEAQAAFVELKYHQVILKRPRAGIPQALSWAKSPDPDIQMLAIGILKNANAPVALATLNHLAGASNYEVSQAAKRALAAEKKGGKPRSTH
ncbi:MAG: HEAT repeat domain-containing protein [Bryobacteraceae bacterium]